MGCGECERMIHVTRGSGPNINTERQAAFHLEGIVVRERSKMF